MTIADQKQLIQLFAQCVKENQMHQLREILASNGSFEIQDKGQNHQKVRRDQFIRWIEGKLAETKIETVEYDQCLHCKIGATVILFNEGYFPRISKNSIERPKSALFLDFHDGQIVEIKFCYLFLNNENDFDL